MTAPDDMETARLAAMIGTHGRSGYNRGCRCEVCCTEHRTHAREWRKSAQKRLASIPDTVTHGAACYVNWGCRCEVCIAANRAQSRPAVARYQETHREEIAARRRRTQSESLANATRYGYPWTGPELELAARTDLTIAQIAAMTGRTVIAVKKMRRRLKNDPKIINLAGLPALRHADENERKKGLRP